MRGDETDGMHRSVVDAAEVSLRAAAREERATLENLAQLYCHDWSELLPIDVGADGRFGALSLEPYWVDDWRHPLLIRVGEALAGFALVAARSRLTGRVGVFDMAEFFVMRRFRRQGVGLTAARLAFVRFKGPWEIRERRENVTAIAFWRRAIDVHTAGNYGEIPWIGSGEEGVAQTFVSR